ncbi:MAG: 30S ribosomal protein S16 [Elusimicrobia bacterium]|nr:30S ribosomal protein S16 [Elusimicrobiota bacterium]MBD3412661.1 30S ribosomal protein S16 [Elusimicrobiota bacterium]
MSVKLRFKRVGKKKFPCYRLIAIDSRRRRDGRPIEIIGNYNPHAGHELFEYNKERLVYWLANGAQASDRVRTVLMSHGSWKEVMGSAHR